MIVCPFPSPALTEHSCHQPSTFNSIPKLKTTLSSHLFPLTISLTMGCVQTRSDLLSNIINNSNDQSTQRKGDNFMTATQTLKQLTQFR